MYQILLVKKWKKKLKVYFLIRISNELLNNSVDRINSIDALSIVLLKEFLLFDFPNKRVLTILISLSVNMFAFIVAILSERACFEY